MNDRIKQLVDIDKMNDEINHWTRAFDIRNFEGPDETVQNKNAFAHAYASAHIAYEHSIPVSNILGNLRELSNFTTGSINALLGKPRWTTKGVWLDGHRDMFNNQIGNQIARYAKRSGLPKEALGYLVVDAVRNGQLIADEKNDKRVRVLDYDRPHYSGPSNVAIGQIRYLFGADLVGEDDQTWHRGTTSSPERQFGTLDHDVIRTTSGRSRPEGTPTGSGSRISPNLAAVVGRDRSRRGETAAPAQKRSKDPDQTDLHALVTRRAGFSKH